MAVKFPMPTVMSSSRHFAQVPNADIERSTFDRSSGHKTTFNAGFLVPIFVDEVLPGDTFNLRMSALVRLTTPVKPVMDNMYLDSFFFFVPYRIIWTHWVNMMGEQVNPGDSTSFTVPVISTAAFAPALHSLFDYMGVMAKGAGGAAIQSPNLISSLPFRAYNAIYNQWFRDENLINSLTTLTGDGPDSPTAFGVAGAPCKRGKRHDYFTSCLPFIQKGTQLSIALTNPGGPAGGTAVPVGTSSSAVLTGAQSALQLLLAATGAAPANNSLAAAAGQMSASATALAGANPVYPSNLQISLVGVGFTISSLRLAVQLQKMLERDARGGTRYTELLKAHFRVTSPDARLQRPEYLGGGSTPITVSPVVQVSGTSITGQATPQANLAGVGAGAVQGHGFVKSFTEHGVIIGIVNVRADLTYQSGVERMWFRQTRFDFFWPALAHLSEQSVLNEEIWFDGTTANNAQDVAVFGYQERFAEYRYKPSRISGQMRSYAATPFDIWHLAEKFGALPVLAQTFIEDQTHSILNSRISATVSEPDFYGDFFFKLICARPMPVFGVPGLMDHF